MPYVNIDLFLLLDWFVRGVFNDTISMSGYRILNWSTEKEWNELSFLKPIFELGIPPVSVLLKQIGGYLTTL